MHPLPPWSRRDNFSVPAHQRLVDGINSLSFITGTGDMEVTSTPGGRTVHNNRPVQLNDLFWAEVTDEGPNGEEAPDAPEFWLRRQRIDVQDDDPDEPEVSLVDDEVADGNINVDEDGEFIADMIVKGTDPTGQGSLSVGQKVFVVGMPFVDPENGHASWRNLILPTGGSGLATCRIAGTSSGGVNFGAGKYDAWTQQFAHGFDPANAADIGATNNVDLGSFFNPTTSDVEQVIVWNLYETGTLASTNRTHILGDQWVLAVHVGEEPWSGTNNRKVYLTMALPALTCG